MEMRDYTEDFIRYLEDDCNRNLVCIAQDVLLDNLGRKERSGKLVFSFMSMRVEVEFDKFGDVEEMWVERL